MKAVAVSSKSVIISSLASSMASLTFFPVNLFVRSWVFTKVRVSLYVSLALALNLAITNIKMEVDEEGCTAICRISC